MKIRSYFSLIITLLLSIFSSNVLCADEIDNLPQLPQKFSYLVDFTDTLSADQQDEIEQKLVAFNKESGSQFAVVLIKSTNGYDISQYTFALGQKWGVGRKEKDDGVVMLVAKDDHKMFIATGYGLEGALPDATLSQIIRDVITPNFKQDDYFTGISNGVDAIVDLAKGEYDPDDYDGDSFLGTIILIFFMLFILYLTIKIMNFIGEVVPSLKYENIKSSGSYSSSGGSSSSRSSGGSYGGGSYGGGGSGGSW